MLNIFVALLGCNIPSILENRIKTSFKLTNDIISTNLDYDKIYFKENLHMNQCVNPYMYNNINSNSNSNSNIKKKIDTNINFYWFLSGGIKNNEIQKNTESSDMKMRIEQMYLNVYSKIPGLKITFNYILDEVSTNTAENFVNIMIYLNSTRTNINSYVEFDSVHIITSKYHYARASKMFNLILNKSLEINPDYNSNLNKILYKWELGDLNNPDLIYWERIHMLNIESDVMNAIKKFL